MKANPVPILMSLALSVLLAACGRMDTPAPGTYRSYVKLRGGEVPFQLEVREQDGQWALNRVNGDELQPATHLQLQQGSLRAELPDAAGTLQVTLERNAMKGELHLTDHLGRPQTLPFGAELHQDYRFIEKSSTDNADVSGYWQLEAISPEHFSTPVTVQLQQHFDAVDGQLRLPDGRQLSLLGQVKGDALYLSALAQGRALLFKGKVNQQGELVGQLWTNLSNAHNWVARRMVDPPDITPAETDSLRPVLLHWAVPGP